MTGSTKLSRIRLVAIAVLLCVGSGCASLKGEPYAAYDENENLNRKIYKLTDRVDRGILQPVSRGYQRITPNWLERAIANFFLNLTTIDSSVNGFLQGKPKSGAIDFGRIIINSTLGVGGLIDVAGKLDLPYQEEDFGQTLAVWGVSRTRYIYLPLRGPVTLRDLPGTIITGAVPRLILGTDYGFGLAATNLISARAEALGVTDVRDASALDPYAFTRDAYYQRRKFLIFDGQPPLDDFADEFGDEFEDDFDDEEDFEDDFDGAALDSDTSNSVDSGSVDSASEDPSSD